MKWLAWLLLFINVGLLTYFNVDRILPSAPSAKTTEINPEKISVLSQKEIDALPKKSNNFATSVLTAKTTSELMPAATLTVTTCFEWGIFSSASLVGAQGAIARLSLQAAVKEQTSQDAKRFWVYKPPLKSAVAAQNKVLELQALGVDDLFVVQEPRWRNAISFGVFEDEQLASNLLNELKAKGIKDAVKALRNQGRQQFSLMFNNLTDTNLTQFQQLKSQFPEASLKEVTCR